MSVVTFFSNDKAETSQTTSMAAIATYLSIEQNYRILLINTKHNDTSLQECFWEQSKDMRSRTDLETGITGLIKAIASNKISPEIITNYTRTIFKEKLEVLTDGNILKEDYIKQKEYMKSIIRLANKFYDLVFVDAEGDLEDPNAQAILQESNLIIANTSQRIKIIRDFLEDRKKYKFLTNDNTIVLMGKYDKYSKYNAKNLQRAEKIQDIYGIPYNTLFFEACNEGNLADFMINYRKVKQSSVQAPIIESISEIANRIIDKLKELQMQA